MGRSAATPDFAYPPRASFDGGDLDCGNGLLLLIRQHIDPLAPGELLQIGSRERSVCEDLPAWCRLTGNQLVDQREAAGQWWFLVSKGVFRPERFAPPAAAAAAAPAAAAPRQLPAPRAPVPVVPPASLPAPAPAPAIPPLAVTGIGSWPRPFWLLDLLHQHLEGRLDDAAFHSAADDAVRLAVQAQLRAGVDLVTDGEQRRDNYASFVGAKLDNCQLVPITDLLPYVDDPEQFARELAALDVPATKVRHPAVFGPLGRSRPLAGEELQLVQSLTDRPVKVALPGPYLLTRTMWMECISDRAYRDRDALAVDVVRVLREEIHHLLAAGAALVQLDEPVLSEVVFGNTRGGRSFMCGALGQRLAAGPELAFASALLQQVTAGLPRERLALHVCRGNWTPDESAALRGDYGPLLPFLAEAPVGTLLLEACTERAGDRLLLAELPARFRLGIGVVDQKRSAVESVEQVLAHIEPLLARVGPERLLLHPDCGFATFADNPLGSAAVAEQKLAAVAAAARELRRRCGLPAPPRAN